MATRKSGPLDAMVGTRISMLRVNRGMSQAMLAERIGVTFQQMQKYERGANRVGASRLSQVAAVWVFRSAHCSNLPRPIFHFVFRRSWLRASPVKLPGAKATVGLFNTVDRGERRSFPREDSLPQEGEWRSRACPAIRLEASAGRADRKPLRRPHARNELADPVTARRFDMPGHCLGRIGCRIGNVLADLFAVEPAAAVRVARLADEMDVAVVLEQQVAIGRKKCPAKLDRAGNGTPTGTCWWIAIPIRKPARRPGCGSARSPAVQPGREAP